MYKYCPHYYITEALLNNHKIVTANGKHKFINELVQQEVNWRTDDSKSDEPHEQKKFSTFFVTSCSVSHMIIIENPQVHFFK